MTHKGQLMSRRYGQRRQHGGAHSLWQRMNAVTLENYGEAPWLFKCIVLLAVVLFVFGFGWVLAISPLLSQRETLQIRQETLLEDYRHKYQQTRHLTALNESLLQADKTFAQTLEQLPTAWQTARLVEYMHTQATSSGVRIEDVVVENPAQSSEPLLMQRGIRITATGGYHALGHWLARLSSAPYLLTLHDFTLHSEADAAASAPVLKLQLTAKTYRAKSKDEQDSERANHGDAHE